MKNMSNIVKSYVPIIRWRPGEVRAIRHLFPKDRSKVTPLFEFILPPPRTDKDDRKIILEDSKTKFLRGLSSITEGILKNWGTDPFFIDVHLLDGDIRASVFETILSSANQLNLFSIPVTYVIPTISTEADKATRNVAVKFAKLDNRGLCIRLDDSHLNGEIQNKIDDFLSKEKLDAGLVDVLIDLKIVDEQTTVKKVLDKLSNVPHMEKWRSVILTGGSFPKDLSKFEKHTNPSLPRFDWLTWQGLIQDKAVKRKPIFSDYTIQHPIFYGHIPGANTSASVRYTDEKVWQVSRGEGIQNKQGAGYKQYPAQAKLLIQQSYYKGADFSFGDAYIAEKAKSTEDNTTGSPQSWLTAGINHHITLVVDQVANLPAK